LSVSQSFPDSGATVDRMAGNMKVSFPSCSHSALRSATCQRPRSTPERKSWGVTWPSAQIRDASPRLREVYLNTCKRGVTFVWFDISSSETDGLKDPALIVAISTSLPQYRALYSQARELGNFMLQKMESRNIATFHSSSLGPEVVVKEDGSAVLPACHMHLIRGKRDLLLLTGDASPMDDQYGFVKMVLAYVRQLGAKELYSVGARWAENPLPADADPQPNGFATDSLGVERLKEFGVQILQEEPAPFFASVIVGLAPEHGMRGYKLSVDHGEPSPHPRSVAKILNALSGLVGFEISTEELRARPHETQEIRQLGDDSIYH